MKRRLVSILTVALNLAMLCVVVLTTMAAEVSKMTKEELKSKLGTPEAVIIDVRSGRDWKASEMKIRGAVRDDPQDLESWTKKYSKDKMLVIYCA
jgi:hypothetical protein